MPSPTPTEAQIDKTREITGERSYTFVLGRIEGLNDSQWARALQLQTAWGDYPEGDTVQLEGGSEGVKYSSETSRGDIRVRMRLLLGLPEMRDAGITGEASSEALRNCFVF
jgi:hypothetical protein